MAHPLTATRTATPGGRAYPVSPAGISVLTGRDTGYGASGERHILAPKSCVHHGPPEPLCTPTPMFLNEQFRMFAR